MPAATRPAAAYARMAAGATCTPESRRASIDVPPPREPVVRARVEQAHRLHREPAQHIAPLQITPASPKAGPQEAAPAADRFRTRKGDRSPAGKGAHRM